MPRVIFRLPTILNTTRRAARKRTITGRKQVNKALHTCTSWYAYAAMFGSSIDTMVPRALQCMYRLHLCLPSYPLLAVFCRPKPNNWGGGGIRHRCYLE